MHQLLSILHPLLFRNAPSKPLSVTFTQQTHVVNAPVKKRERLFALDLARFVAMLGMMQGHVLDALVRPEVLDITQFPWNFWHAARGLTAPVFLVVSGAVHAFANKRGDDGLIREDVLAKRIRWAITIMGIGYLLLFPANRLWDLPFVPADVMRPFLAVNILQLTGATMLLFVITMRKTRSVANMGHVALITAMTILSLTPIVSAISWTGILPPAIIAYVNTSVGSLFPIFPFSAFLFFGVALGSYLHGIPEEQRDVQLKKYGWRIGGTIAAVAWALHFMALEQGVPMEALENASSALLAIRRLGLVLMIFSAAVWVLQRTYRLREWYSLFGNKSLYIYITHLILLFGTPWWNGIGRTHYRAFDLPTGILLMLGIVTATLLFAWSMDKLGRTPFRPELRKGFNIAFTCVLGWLLLV